MKLFAVALYTQKGDKVIVAAWYLLSETIESAKETALKYWLKARPVSKYYSDHDVVLQEIPYQSFAWQLVDKHDKQVLLKKS